MARILTPEEEKAYLAGASPKPKEGFNALISGFTDPISRVGRGIASLPSILTGGKSVYLNNGELDEYKNPMNIAKDVASVASLALPVGGVGQGVMGALKAGAIAGGLGGFGGTYGQNDIGQTLQGTLGGAATGGILNAGLAKALPFLAKGGTIGKVAREGEQIAPNILQKAGKGLQKAGKGLQNTGVEVGLGKAGSFTEKQAQEQLIQDAIRRTKGENIYNPAKAIDTAKNKVGQELGDQYAQHAKTQGNIFGTNDMMSNFEQKDIVRLAHAIKMTPEELVQKMQARLNSYGIKDKSLKVLLSGEAKLSATDLWKLSQDTSGATQKLAKGANLSPADEIDLLLHSQANSLLQNEPSLSSLSKLNSEYHALSNGQIPTGENQIQGQTLRIPFMGSGLGNEAGIGIPIPNITRAGTRIVGKGVEGVGNLMAGKGVGQANIPAFLPFLNNAGLQQGIRKGAIYNATRPQQAGEQAQAMKQPQSMNAPVTNEASDKYDFAFQTMLQQGMSPVDAQKQAQALTGYAPEKETAAMKNGRVALKNASDGLDTLEQLFKEHGSDIPFVGGLSAMNPLDPTSQQFDMVTNLIAQNIAKASEGGKLSDNDRTFFLSKLPKMNDTKATALAKLQMLKQMNMQSQENI